MANAVGGLTFSMQMLPEGQYSKGGSVLAPEGMWSRCGWLLGQQKMAVESAFSGCHNKIPQTCWLSQQFWWLEVQDQGASRVDVC